MYTYSTLTLNVWCFCLVLSVWCLSGVFIFSSGVSFNRQICKGLPLQICLVSISICLQILVDTSVLTKASTIRVRSERWRVKGWVLHPPRVLQSTRGTGWVQSTHRHRRRDDRGRVGAVQCMPAMPLNGTSMHYFTQTHEAAHTHTHIYIYVLKHIQQQAWAVRTASSCCGPDQHPVEPSRPSSTTQQMHKHLKGLQIPAR